MKTVTNIRALSFNIDRIIYEKNLRFRDLRKMVDISPVTLSRILDKRAKKVHLRTVVKIADALGVGVDQLLQYRDTYEIVRIPTHVYDMAAKQKFPYETVADYINYLIVQKQ